MKLYTPLICKALQIAYDAHHGQTDKSGIPYLYHPAFLAAQMDTEDEIITALLHDVVEDTQMTFEDLEKEGFPQSVLDALLLLTHNDGSEYIDYVRRIKRSSLAAKVKLADLRHNSNPTRNANLSPEEAKRYRKKYAEAILVLEKGRTIVLHRSNHPEGSPEEIEQLERGAHDGDSYSLLVLGHRLYDGTGIPRDRKRAFEMYLRAAEQGEASAECRMAEMLLSDEEGVLSDRTKPFWFEQPVETAADKQKVFMYITGRGGVECDLSKAADIAHGICYELRYSHSEYKEPAVELRAIIQQAQSIEHRAGLEAVEKQEYKTAYRHFKRVGGVTACYEIGSMYLLMCRAGLDADKDSAVTLIKKSAEMGYKDALAKLGFMYDAGDEIPEDKAEAVRCLEKAARAWSPGETKIPLRLAEIYWDGLGVPKNPRKAIEWVKEATRNDLNWDVKRAKEIQDGKRRAYGIIDLMCLEEAKRCGHSWAELRIQEMFRIEAGVPKSREELELLLHDNVHEETGD